MYFLDILNIIFRANIYPCLSRPENDSNKTPYFSKLRRKLIDAYVAMLKGEMRPIKTPTMIYETGSSYDPLTEAFILHNPNQTAH